MSFFLFFFLTFPAISRANETGDFSELGPNTFLSELGPQDSFKIKTGFKLPEKGPLHFYQNGSELKKAMVGKFEIKENTCMISHPLITINDVTYYAKELQASLKNSIPVAYTDSYTDDDNSIIITKIKFKENGFQINCTGTKNDAPRLKDLRHHIGLDFVVIRSTYTQK